MPIATMKLVVSEAEFKKWMKYFVQKSADVQEVQLAVISTLISNAAGGKAKVKDFILSGKHNTTKEKPIGSDEVEALFMGML